MNRVAYLLDEMQRSEDGQYLVCMAQEDVADMFVTNWTYGKDKELAQKSVDELNKRMGLTDKDVNDIIISSIAKSNIEKRERKYAWLEKFEQNVINCNACSTNHLHLDFDNFYPEDLDDWESKPPKFCPRCGSDDIDYHDADDDPIVRGE